LEILSRNEINEYPGASVAARMPFVLLTILFFYLPVARNHEHSKQQAIIHEEAAGRSFSLGAPHRPGIQIMAGSAFAFSLRSNVRAAVRLPLRRASARIGLLFIPGAFPFPRTLLRNRPTSSLRGWGSLVFTLIRRSKRSPLGGAGE
jgi:hypothetical protein